MTSNKGQILVFHRIESFGSDKSSSLGNVYSRQVTGPVNCENSSVSLVMNYCPTSTIVKNHAPIQKIMTRFCCENLFTHSWSVLLLPRAPSLMLSHFEAVLFVFRSSSCCMLMTLLPHSWKWTAWLDDLLHVFALIFFLVSHAALLGMSI